MPTAMVIPLKLQAAGDVQFIVTIDNIPYTVNCPNIAEDFTMGKQYTFTFELPEGYSVNVLFHTNTKRAK